MPKGLGVTVRDTRLLHDCYSHAVLSIAQITDRHFPNRAKPTVLNRLTKLRKGGLLARSQVGIVLHYGKSKDIGTVYQITRKGLKLLKASYPNELFREDPVRLNSHSLAHDLLLTDTWASLKKRFPELKSVHGRVLPAARNPNEKIPDAVIFDDTDRPFIAVELELSAKSTARYREIVLQYQVHSHFQAVLYVVGDASIQEKIQFQITQQKPPRGLKKPSTGKFFFCTLKQLQNDPLNASISNGEIELKGEI